MQGKSLKLLHYKSVSNKDGPTAVKENGKNRGKRGKLDR